jgi:hypothetical protein
LKRYTNAKVVKVNRNILKMAIFWHIFSRRVFLKLFSYLFVVPVSLRTQHMVGEQSQTATHKAQSYGIGAYGTGEYPGYRTFFPLISQKGD